MLFTYLRRKNFKGVLYAMFVYFLNGINLYPLVVLTHIVLLLHKNNVYNESYIYNSKDRCLYKLQLYC